MPAAQVLIRLIGGERIIATTVAFLMKGVAVALSSPHFSMASINHFLEQVPSIYRVVLRYNRFVLRSLPLHGGAPVRTVSGEARPGFGGHPVAAGLLRGARAAPARRRRRRHGGAGAARARAQRREQREH